MADIGGTHARLAVADIEGEGLQTVRRFDVARNSDFGMVLDRFLAEVEAAGDRQVRPERACLAVACAVDGDVLRLTNSPWVVDRQAIRARLGGAAVALINDFAAVGHALGGLGAGDWQQLGPGTAVAGRPAVVLGPGTGLGVCSVVPVGDSNVVVEGEGGHVDFAPVTPREVRVHDALTGQFGRVSVERLLSGAGIVNVHRALARIEGVESSLDSPEAISRAAMAAADPLAQETLAMFFAVLGSVAGNLALTLGARGGVYIAGGIVPQLLALAMRSPLRERFEAKGRFRGYLQAIPLRIVTRPELGLLGAAAVLGPGGVGIRRYE